jgi:hypothetical protein
MSEIANSAKKALDTITERVRNPFLFSFLIALVVQNFRFFLVLLSDDPYLVKLSYIDSTLYLTAWDAWRNFLLIPIAGGLAFTLGFPWLDLGITAAREWIGNIHERCILRLRRQKPIAEDHLADLHASYAAEKNELIAELQRQGEAFSVNNAANTAKIEHLKRRLSRLAIQVALANVQLDWQRMGMMLIAAQPLDGETQKAIKMSPYFNQLVEAFQIVEQTTADLNKNRRVHRTAFGPELTEEDAWKKQNVIEMLIALGVLEETSLDGTFRATYEGVKRFGKFFEQPVRVI